MNQQQKDFLESVKKKLAYHEGAGLIHDLNLEERATSRLVEISFKINLEFAGPKDSEYALSLKEMLYHQLENTLIDAQLAGLIPQPPSTNQLKHKFYIDWDKGIIQQIYRY